MQIHNPSNLKTIDYRIVKALQGNLKDLSTENHDKLLRVLEHRGFTTPLFVWWSSGDFYLLDGNQRHRVMSLNEMRDETKPEGQQYDVPYVLIDAPDEKTAKEMLLEITSQYGRITQDGLDEFVDLAEIDVDQLDVNFDALPDFSNDLEAPETSEKDKGDKEPSWTLDQLQTLAVAFTQRPGAVDVMTFLDWLKNESQPV